MKNGHDPVRSGYHKQGFDADERVVMPGKKMPKKEGTSIHKVALKKSTPMYSGAKKKGK